MTHPDKKKDKEAEARKAKEKEQLKYHGGGDEDLMGEDNLIDVEFPSAPNEELSFDQKKKLSEREGKGVLG